MRICSCQPNGRWRGVNDSHVPLVPRVPLRNAVREALLRALKVDGRPSVSATPGPSPTETPLGGRHGSGRTRALGAQAAGVAARPGAADLLAVAHDQGVIGIEAGDIGAERGLEGGADGLVALVVVEQAEPGKDAAGVGVDDEDRAVEGVEQDVIGGLRARRPRWRAGGDAGPGCPVRPGRRVHPRRRTPGRRRAGAGP